MQTIGFLLIAATAVAAPVVDGNVPAGNVVVEKIEGDKVRLSREMRDSKGSWFYWAFRVKGAKGRTLKFVFDPKICWGGPVGVRGPAVTTDGGKSWCYPCDGTSTKNEFAYTVAWACTAVKGLKIARTYEVPFATANGAVVTPQSCRDLGRDTAKVFRALLAESLP